MEGGTKPLAHRRPVDGVSSVSVYVPAYFNFFSFKNVNGFKVYLGIKGILIN